MCRKNITIPFKFWCYTDDPTDLDPRINVVDFYNQDLFPVVYNKLFILSKQFRDLLQNDYDCVFFDLDMVIQHNIDRLFEHFGSSLKVIKAIWKPEEVFVPTMHHPYYNHNINSSCMLWKNNSCDDIWQHFVSRKEEMLDTYCFGMDAFLYYEIGLRGGLPEDMFFSYKYGIDLNLSESSRDANGMVHASRLRTIQEMIPIILLNGLITTPEHYNFYELKFKRFYED